MQQIDPVIVPKALNDLSHLASGVGHHVINAFSAIVSNAELLRIRLASKTNPIDPSSIADMIIDSAMEASTVARRLIDYTRPITDVGENRVFLDQLISDYVQTRRETDSGETRWTTHLEPVPPIRGQSSHLESMLDLLVANSLEAMTADGEKAIAISTSIDSRGWVMLEIRDTGRGMASEVLEQAVEPFFTTKSGHLGVGLSIANGIWRRHRGTLSLRSQPEEGTCLRLCVEPSEA